jgi:hypothetical protein
MAGIGRKSDALALALAAGDSIADAAAKAGMSERTARRRLADPSLRQHIEKLRAAMIERALGRMADSMTEAADVLRALLQAKTESVRLGAARSLLDLGTKVRDAVDMEARVAELERDRDLERERDASTRK